VKISGARLESFIRQPDPGIEAILVYGPDMGLVRERINAIALGVVDDLADPFRVAELTPASIREDPSRLYDEAAMLSFSGGRRLVRIHDAGDNVAAAFENFLAAPPGSALVVVDGGDLGPRSSLRRAFESSPHGAAIPCYGDDDRSLRGVIGEVFEKHGLKASGEVYQYLSGHLGSDRVVTRNELEKLALYVGRPGDVSLDAASACIGDNSATSLDALIFAVADGNFGGLEQALEKAISEGTNPVRLLGSVSRHFQRLHFAVGLVSGGRSGEDALRALRPPVFFKFKDRFRRQMGQWTLPRLAAALEVLTAADLDCKTTGLPAQAICSRALMKLCQMGRSSARRR
jgi:DNA polymerase III subunit delta